MDPQNPIRRATAATTAMGDPERNCRDPIRWLINTFLKVIILKIPFGTLTAWLSGCERVSRVVSYYFAAAFSMTVLLFV